MARYVLLVVLRRRSVAAAVSGFLATYVTQVREVSAKVNLARMARIH